MIEILNTILAGLLPLLRTFCTGEYGIALGGSYAKGLSDEHSDIDIYLFAHQILPCDQRTAQLIQGPGLFTEIKSWGDDADFVDAGTDFWYAGRKVECWLRNIQRIEKTLQACRAGQIERDYIVWTVMGFYNYTALSDIRIMQVVDDPFGILGHWKTAVADYPIQLQESILRRYLAEARFWPDNFHYRSAVERRDILYTSGIVQQVVYALLQVVFALNRVYFPGEKKVEESLRHLAIQPDAFAQRLRELVYPGNAAEIQHLQAQREALSRLVHEVDQLAQ
jgi:hypothetical protein